MNASPTILIVDDSADDQLLFQRALKGCGCNLVMAQSAETGLARIADPHSPHPDMILLDYSLPGMDGLSFMKMLPSNIPIVMLTGENNATVAVEVMKHGASDYLIKDTEGQYLRLLPVVVERVMAAHAQREQTRLLRQKNDELMQKLCIQQIELEMQNEELRQAQLAMAESRDRYMDLYDFAPIGYLTLTREALIAEINLTGAALLGKKRCRLINTRFTLCVTPDDRDRWHRHFMDTLQRNVQQSFELMLQNDNGASFHAQLDCLHLEKNDTTTMRVIITDISERKQAEAQREKSLSLLQATLESTNDAILVVDFDRTWVLHNQQFVDMWHIPDEIIASRDDRAALSLVLNQLNDPEDFLNKVLELYATPEASSFDMLRFKDGRIIERHSIPQRIEGKVTGRVWSFSDVTMRERVAKTRLLESEERFRGTLEQAAVGIAHASLDGKLQQVNQKFCSIVGYERYELLQMSFRDITFPEDMQESVRHIRQLLAGEITTYAVEKRYVRKDLSLVWANLTVSLLRDAYGTPKFTIGVIEDITKRKQSEALLQQFGSLLQSSFNEIYIFDACSLHFILTSEGAERNLGYASDELKQLTMLEIKPLFTKESFEHLVAPLRSGERQSLFFETVHRRKDGTDYPVEVRLQLMRGDSPVFLSVIQDITERKYTERRLRDLTAHIQTVREEEKTAIAREIHDNLGSTLTALKTDIYWLADKLPSNKETMQYFGHIESMSQLLDNAVEITRQIITDLRPTMLDDLGLQATLEWYSEQFSKRSGIQCWVVCNGREFCNAGLNRVQSINLFRIFQESLTNIVRHSGASEVETELFCDDEEIIMTISDNGRGLPDGHTLVRNSYGMLGMRERAGQMGGRINFYSPPGGGFSVTVILPFSYDNRDEGKA